MRQGEEVDQGVGGTRIEELVRHAVGHIRQSAVEVVSVIVRTITDDRLARMDRRQSHVNRNSDEYRSARSYRWPCR